MSVVSSTLEVARSKHRAARSNNPVATEICRGGPGAQGESRRPARERLREANMSAVGIAEDAIHYGVALVLIVVAGIVLYHTASELATAHQQFGQAATTALSGLLFAIIVMEVMRTVMAHFEPGGLHIQPFLVIGIISAVREILSVGAHLSLEGGSSSSTVHLALLELAVNGGLVVGMAVALVLVRRLARMRDGR